jgi:hypothetical protein
MLSWNPNIQVAPLASHAALPMVTSKLIPSIRNMAPVHNEVHFLTILPFSLPKASPYLKRTSTRMTGGHCYPAYFKSGASPRPPPPPPKFASLGLKGGVRGSSVVQVVALGVTQNWRGTNSWQCGFRVVPVSVAFCSAVSLQLRKGSVEKGMLLSSIDLSSWRSEASNSSYVRVHNFLRLTCEWQSLRDFFSFIGKMAVPNFTVFWDDTYVPNGTESHLTGPWDNAFVSR